MFDKAACEKQAKEIRRRTVRAIGHLGVGHIGGSLSIADVLAVLYFDAMKVDPRNPKKEGRDRLVISKGHSGPALYAALSMVGFIPESELDTLNQMDTNLPSHCDMNRTPGVDMTTGSLGQGFSCAVGVALGSVIRKDSAHIYTIIGDGESQEGQIWEAAMYAAQKKLDRLIAFTDYNGLQIDGPVDEINSLGDIAAKWRAFGWDVQQVDGHDVAAIRGAIENAHAIAEKPHMILLKTVKGKGVSFVEEMGAGNHNSPFTAQQMETALAELA